MKRFFAVLLVLSVLITGGAFAESGREIKGSLFTPEETEAAEEIPAEEASEAAENAGTDAGAEDAPAVTSEEAAVEKIPDADAALIRRSVEMAEAVVKMAGNEGYLAMWSATEEERAGCKEVAAVEAAAPVRAYLAYLGEDEEYYARALKLMRVSDDLLMITAREMIGYSVSSIGEENSAEYLLSYYTSCAPIESVSESAVVLLESESGTLIRVYFERADDGSMYVQTSPVWLGKVQAENLSTGGLAAVLNYADSAIEAGSVSYADESLKLILQAE